jgi:hypothetical protein
MWRIYVFHLRFIGRGKPNWPIEAWRETVSVEHNNYDSALKDARKEFIRRQNGYLDDIDFESIEVLDWEFA